MTAAAGVIETRWASRTMRGVWCATMGVAAMALPGLVLLAGCGGKPGLAVYPVSGRVTQDGKPVAGALISFSPATPAEGFAGAQVQSDA